MIISEVLTTVISLTHKELTGSMKDMLLRKARERYVGKCFGGFYILEVIDLEQSHIIMSLAGGTATIRVRCNVLKYHPDEIIMGAVVTCRSKIGGYTICENKEKGYVATVSDAENFHSLNIGQIIPVRILDVTYPIGQNAVSITASINVVSFIDVPKRMFEIDLPKKVGNMEEFSEILGQIKDELSKVKSLDGLSKKKYNQFKKILYPYVNPPKYNTKLVNSITEFKTGKILKWDVLENDSLNVLYLNTEITDKKIKDLKDIDISMENVLGINLQQGYIEAILLIIHEKLMFLKFLREMTESYSDKEFKSHSNIWVYYEKHLKKRTKKKSKEEKDQ